MTEYKRGQYEKGYADGKRDAADAIEALQAEKKKTVTQIFGEEQQEWEEYCTGLMNRIKELEAQLPKKAHFVAIDNGCGVCSNCNRQDRIDSIATYCRYCGAKMEVQDA